MDEKEKIKQEIQENLLDEALNFHDASVGIYSCNKLDKDVIESLADLEGVEIVSWNDYQMNISVDDKYRFTIKLVDGEWKFVEPETFSKIVITIEADELGVEENHEMLGDIMKHLGRDFSDRKLPKELIYKFTNEKVGNIEYKK